MEHSVFYYKHYFINNTFLSMFKGIGEFFKNTVFPRATELIISTYEKGVQHYLQRINTPGEKMAPNYPFLVLDPGVDFEPDPQYGRFLYKFPLTDLGINDYNNVYLYSDQNVDIYISFNFFKGSFDLYLWCSSLRELIDSKMFFYNYFAGHGRYFTPRNIKGYVVLPDELKDYKYKNEYTGEEYTIDLTQKNENVKQIFIKNINQIKNVYVYDINPLIRFVDSPEASYDKYGGGDELSSARLDIRLEYECFFPTFIVLKNRYGIKKAEKENVGFVNNIPSIVSYTYSQSDLVNINFSNNLSEIFFLPNKLNVNYIGKDYSNKTIRANENLFLYKTILYILTELDENIIKNESSNILIRLDEPVSDAYHVFLITKYMALSYGSQWVLPQKNLIELISKNLKFLKKDDSIWIGLYKEEVN